MKRKIKNKRLAKVADLVISLYHLDVPVYAANAAYFIIMAVFPTIMLLLNLLSYTTLNGGALLDVIANVVPDALMPTVERLLGSMFASSSTTLASVTALAALWAASRGVYGILVGLNRIYGVQEDRGYVFTRLLSLVYTFLFLLVLLLTLAIHVFGQTILAQLPSTDNSAFRFLMEVVSSRFLLLLFIQTALFTAMFMFLPNRHNSFMASLPGALLASLGWLVFSDLFSIYVKHFSNYSTVYGSLSAVVIAMLWLYTCVAIVFYGGAINKYLSDVGYRLRLRRQKKKKEEI